MIAAIVEYLAIPGGTTNVVIRDVMHSLRLV